MRRRMIVVGFAMLVVAASAMPASARADDTVGVRGTVTSALTGAPVPRAIVGVFADHNSRAVQLVRTKADGSYAFRSLEARSYEVCVDVAHYPVDDPSGFGFLSRCYADAAWHPGGQFDPIPSDAAEVDLSGGGVATGVDIALPPGATVSGQVIDAATGDPLEGVDVRLSGASSAASTSVTTGADGRYALSDVEPGPYHLCWFTERLEVQSADPSPTGYLDQCYYRVRVPPYSEPGRDAVVIDLAGGQSYAYSTALRRAAGIAGTVVDARDGSPVAGIRVTMPGAYSGATLARTAADGTYAVKGLDTRSGTSVCFDSDPGVDYPGSRTAYAPACVDVDRLRFGGFATADAGLEPGARILGQVRINGGVVAYRPVLLFDAATGAFVTSRTTASSGRYEAAGLTPSVDGYVVCSTDLPYARPRCFDDTPWAGPGNPPPSGALPVPVAAGRTATVDIVLHPRHLS